MELNQREKILIIIAGIILIPLVLFRFVIVPFSEYQSSQQQNINRLESTVKNVILLGEEARFYSADTQTRPASLSRTIDLILRTLRIKPKSQITVENFPGKEEQRLVLKVNDINLTELVNLIYKIEHSKPVIIIESIEISQSFQNKRLFRVSSALSGK